MKLYFLHIVIGLNQLAATILGAWPDETLSAYAYRLEQQGNAWGKGWRIAIDWLARAFFKQDEHCKKAQMEERARVQLPPESR